MSTSDFSKPYSPNNVERGWYARWLASGAFRATDSQEPSGAFSIAIPPPNVTGSLHMGHALMVTIQDVIIRSQRMQGKNTLWLPGIDHAGISTQVVVERELRREGLSTTNLGRDAFIDRVWKWKARSGDRIYEQSGLGASCDWDRARFTMDPDMSRAVGDEFVRLYEEGLIYRANRLVNWSIKAQTVISDLEVVREEPDPTSRMQSCFRSHTCWRTDPGRSWSRRRGPRRWWATRPSRFTRRLPALPGPRGQAGRSPLVDRRFAIIADGTLADPTKGSRRGQGRPPPTTSTTMSVASATSSTRSIS